MKNQVQDMVDWKVSKSPLKKKGRGRMRTQRQIHKALGFLRLHSTFSMPVENFQASSPRQIF